MVVVSGEMGSECTHMINYNSDFPLFNASGDSFPNCLPALQSYFGLGRREERRRMYTKDERKKGLPALMAAWNSGFREEG